MKRLLYFVLASAALTAMLSGCSGSESKMEKRVAVSEDSGMQYFDTFFSAYEQTEAADSLTKDKTIELNMFEDTDSPYEVTSKTHCEQMKNGDEYDCKYEMDDTVNGEEIKDSGFYTGGKMYYDSNDGSYEMDSTWNEAKYTIDGDTFELYDYTVSGANCTEYDDGSMKITFDFDLAKLVEAPDEEIFEILAASGTSYQKLSFNEATFEAYIDSDGYVESYVMYYDGQVNAGSEPLTFKYKTTVGYSDVNKTVFELPEDRENYEHVEPETQTEAQQNGWSFNGLE